MKWTSAMYRSEERTTKLGDAMSRGRVQNVKRGIHSSNSDIGRRRKSLKLKKMVSKRPCETETIVISSGVSEGESNAREIPSKVARKVQPVMPITFPPSPQSDYGEDMEQDLTNILKMASASGKLHNEVDTYTPASPASLNSPRESSPDLSDDDVSEHRVKWGNIGSVDRTLSEHTYAKVSNVCRGGVLHIKNEAKIRLERQRSDWYGPERVQANSGREKSRDTFRRSDLDRCSPDLSDFEEALSKSTAIALSQAVKPPSEDSVESDEELPEIDYYRGETSQEAICWDSLDHDEPPVLGKFGQSPTRHEVDHHTNFYSDADGSSSKGTGDEIEDRLEPNETDLHSPSSNSSEECSVPNFRPSCSIFRDNEISTQHLWMSNCKDLRRSGSPMERAPTRFTSHMVNLIEACHDENFVEASVSLIRTFTTTRIAPSPETLSYLFNSVLLGQDIPGKEACQAYQVLQHINRLHPITNKKFDIDWELVGEIVYGLLGKATFSKQPFGSVERNTASWMVANSDRLLLALKFIVCVMENSAFRCNTDSCSVGSRDAFTLERYMVKDVLQWLEDSITVDLLGSFRGQQPVQELVEQLQKIISISCLEEHGDHLDYITLQLVHKLDEMSLEQKQTLLQTSCHRLRCKLIELYLGTRYEVPSCPSCRTDCSKVYLPQRPSLAKIFMLHVHQRPLDATQNRNDDDECEEEDFIEEETGERVRRDKKLEISADSDEAENAVRRHCVRCSRRIPLKAKQCEEFLLLLVSLLQSFIVCANAGNHSSRRTSSTLTEEDVAILRRLKAHVHTLSTDLLLSCSKHSPRTRLYLKQMALLQDTVT
ncbi:uncharacterized protein [Apostichopus japonicus]